MTVLQEYCAYIRQHKMSAVIQEQLQLLQHAPPLFVFANETGSQQQVYEESFQHFLLAIENGKGEEYTRQRLQLFEENKIPGIAAGATMSMVKETFTAQKISLINAIEFFTTDVRVAIEIAIAIEKLYAFGEALLIKVFENKQQEFLHRISSSEEQYKDLFEAAHDMIHIVKPDGTIQYVNNAWMQCLGYELTEIQGKPIYDFITEEGRQSFISYRQDILNGKLADKEITVAFKSKNGKKIIAEGFISAKKENGKAVATRGIFRDVTTRVKNEEQLQFYVRELAEREENLKQLITHAPDAIIVADSAGRIVLWNPKAENIFGWQSSEALGQTLDNTIIPNAYKQAHANGMKRYLSTGEAHILNQTIEITAMHQSGKEFPISLTISRSQQNGETIFISFSRDISQQKKAELELKRKHTELENSNRELEQYAWLTSHDLREPLRKILTFSDLITTRYNDSLHTDVKTFLQKIQDAGKRMGNLIEAILLYSGITEDRRLFDVVDMNLLAREVLSDLEVDIKESGAIIEKDELPVLEAVPFQMKQLLQNLLSNAIKYKHPDRSPVIKITSHNLNATAIQLQVSDNGKGFSMQDERKIFGLFQRLNADKSIKGTGVGLAICKKIVLNHGGTIQVQSQPEVGTSFTITLPIKQANTAV